jgi:tetratricopeptide (TPR) repeat protein
MQRLCAGVVAVALSIAATVVVAAPGDAATAPTLVLGVRIDALMPPATSEAGKRLQAGLAALRRNDLAGAESELRAAAQAAPDSAAPPLALAEAAALRGNHAEALVHVQQAVKLAPQSAAVYAAEARLRTMKKDYLGAIASLDKALAREPRSAKLHVDKGEIYAMGLHDGAEAQAEYRAALAIDPDSAAAHFALGVWLEQAKRYADAQAELARATELAPDNASAWVALGAARAGAGDRTNALAAYDTAAKLAPTLWTAHAGRADVLDAQGRVDEAIAAYEEALKTTPHKARVLTQLGALQQRAHRGADAEKSYRAALAVDARNVVASNNLAFLLADERRNLDEALRLANTVIQRVPPSSDYAWDTLAWVRRARGELDEAAKILEPIAARTRSPGQVYHLGVIYADMGRKRDALAMFDKALRLEPGYAPAAEARSKLAASG